AECPKLTDRAGELLRSRLQLGEEADVLDGDDRLVREGLQEGNLAIGKWLGRRARHGDHTHRGAFPQHGYGEHTASADRTVGLPIPPVLRIDLDIGHVGDTALEDHPANDEGTARTPREYTTDRIKCFGSVIVMRHKMHQFAVE